MLKKRFAVIKLWPHLKAAEDECIARLKVAAGKLGIECVEVDADARLLVPPRTVVTARDVDFVLSLHYEQPKRFNIFSFVALWNPTQFFHEWGYRKCTDHLLTFDDFLSCSSTGADDHVRRAIAHDPTRAEPAFHLYHSLAGPVFEPSLGEQKLVYTGINWERLGRKPGRHDELLKLLDRTGKLRIFGPKIFQGVDVWEGYQSYSGPLPFDGVSIVEQIHRAGIGLVLSSAAHKESELMSNRLFESLAAGAVVIADENPFARRFFGDTLLYLDTEAPASDVAAQLERHLHWIETHPRDALDLAERSQAIFARDFTLCGSLSRIYENLEERKRFVASLYAPPAGSGRVSLVLLLPDFEPAALERHLESVRTQQLADLDVVLCVTAADYKLFRERIDAAIAESAVRIEILECEFYKPGPQGVRTRRALGRVLWQILGGRAMQEFVCFAGPNETLFADHLASLQSAILRGDRKKPDEPLGGAYSMLVRDADHENGERHTTIEMQIDWSQSAPGQPLGIGRFMFRTADLEPSLGSVLPYTDALALHTLAGSRPMASTRRSTLLLDVRHAFNLSFLESKPAQEREVISDYVPEWPSAEGVAATPVIGVVGSEVLQQAFEQLSPEARVKIAVQLAHSIPIPSFISKFALGAYRFWLHRVRGQSPGTPVGQTGGRT